MANMSYCRFQNTLQALRACFNALRDEGIAGIESSDEREAAEALVKLARKFIDEYNSNESDEGEIDLADRCWE